MQVAHVEDNITHIVLGQETMDMGVSDSAEFFQILSSTLYTNQILAVVRETICNAWDAHIDSGNTDIPIQITLTDSEFIIRDFGKGIKHELIQPIYGVYGNSTKKNNGKETGGFGLGCKAPFAYTEHFQVTSHHEGKMSIYAMSKSSGETMGKPGITPIVHNIPSLDHGIEVKIPIKASNEHQFLGYVKQVVRNGEIKATLNEVEIDDLIELNKSKNGFIITNLMSQPGNVIYLRYGNVIYPVSNNEFYSKEYDLAYRKFKDVIPNTTYAGTSKYNLVLMADPNTIAVTPSRESLSNQSHTLKNVKLLLEKFNENFSVKISHHIPKLILDAVHKIPVENFLTKDFFVWYQKDEAKSATTPFQCAKLKLTNHGTELTKRARKLAIQALVDATIIEKSLAYSWLKHAERDIANHYIRADRWGNGYTYSRLTNNWAMRNIIGPLVQRIKETNHLTPNDLLIQDYSITHDSYSRKNHAHYGKYQHLALKANWDKHQQVLPLLRKNVILSRTYLGIQKINTYENFPNSQGNCNGIFLYVVGAKEEAYDEALAFFKKENFNIKDLIPDQLKELKRQREARKQVTQLKLAMRDESLKNVEPRKYKKGVVLANACLTEQGISDKYVARAYAAPKINDPEFVFKQKDLNSGYILGFYYSYTFIHKMGSKGGIATNTKQYDNYIEKGAMSFQDYYIHWVCDEIATNENIHKAMQSNIHRIKRAEGEDHRTWVWILGIEGNRYLIEHFGLAVELNEDEKMFVDAWNNLKHKDHDQIKLVKKRLAHLEINPRVQELYEDIHSSSGLQYLDRDILDSVAHSETAREIFFLALNSKKEI